MKKALVISTVFVCSGLCGMEQVEPQVKQPVRSLCAKQRHKLEQNVAMWSKNDLVKHPHMKLRALDDLEKLIQETPKTPSNLARLNIYLEQKRTLINPQSQQITPSFVCFVPEYLGKAQDLTNRLSHAKFNVVDPEIRNTQISAFLFESLCLATRIKSMLRNQLKDIGKFKQQFPFLVRTAYIHKLILKNERNILFAFFNTIERLPNRDSASYEETAITLQKHIIVLDALVERFIDNATKK
ncbi:MAG: hypothetical protein UU47_C0002G0045 [candidate division TM6 bacterium GW2011_GWE2_41_16]|nr:MAG: hypothetical protein UU47_C0002G0045 [candidate division TM6 bacterium GW2011_GWE2_41_16]